LNRENSNTGKELRLESRGSTFKVVETTRIAPRHYGTYWVYTIYLAIQLNRRATRLSGAINEKVKTIRLDRPIDSRKGF
jgi:hypothetical protein